MGSMTMVLAALHFLVVTFESSSEPIRRTGSVDEQVDEARAGVIPKLHSFVTLKDAARACLSASDQKFGQRLTFEGGCLLEEFFLIGLRSKVDTRSIAFPYAFEFIVRLTPCGQGHAIPLVGGSEYGLVYGEHPYDVKVMRKISVRFN
jgi:hypothetical protein